MLKNELSIIIPIYNTEPSKLERSLKSIKNIKNVSYEVIIINDGSAEEKAEKYKKISLKYKNTCIFNQENKGVSAARNYGVLLARGDYIMFVDADDIILPDNLCFKNKDYFKNIFKTNNIIAFDLEYIKETGIEKLKSLSFEKEGEYNNKEVALDFLLKDKFYSSNGKIYKKSFLQKNDIRFNTDLIQAEDAMFNLECIEKINKIFYIPIPIYGYYYSVNSYNDRWRKHHSKILKNLKYTYVQKEKIIDKMDLSKEIVDHLQNKDFSQLFRIALINENIKACKKEELLNYIINRNFNSKKLNFINKLKYLLLFRTNNKILKIISDVRINYLKLKGKGD